MRVVARLTDAAARVVAAHAVDAKTAAALAARGAGGAVQLATRPRRRAVVVARASGAAAVHRAADAVGAKRGRALARRRAGAPEADWGRARRTATEIAGDAIRAPGCGRAARPARRAAAGVAVAGLRRRRDAAAAAAAQPRQRLLARETRHAPAARRVRRVLAGGVHAIAVRAAARRRRRAGRARAVRDGVFADRGARARVDVARFAGRRACAIAAARIDAEPRAALIRRRARAPLARLRDAARAVAVVAAEAVGIDAARRGTPQIRAVAQIRSACRRWRAVACKLRARPAAARVADATCAAWTLVAANAIGAEAARALVGVAARGAVALAQETLTCAAVVAGHAVGVGGAGRRAAEARAVAEIGAARRLRNRVLRRGDAPGDSARPARAAGRRDAVGDALRARAMRPLLTAAGAGANQVRLRNFDRFALGNLARRADDLRRELFDSVTVGVRIEGIALGGASRTADQHRTGGERHQPARRLRNPGACALLTLQALVAHRSSNVPVARVHPEHGVSELVYRDARNEPARFSRSPTTPRCTPFARRNGLDREASARNVGPRATLPRIPVAHAPDPLRERRTLADRTGCARDAALRARLHEPIARNEAMKAP